MLQFIQKKRQEEAVAFAEEKAKQNESIFKDDADDDLYNWNQQPLISVRQYFYIVSTNMNSYKLCDSQLQA